MRLKNTITHVELQYVIFLGKKVHTGGGFSGKGFKFDESEAAAVNEKKKFQKAALGLADSDDEDLEHDIDQQIESMFATKRTVKEIKAPLGERSFQNIFANISRNYIFIITN